MTAIKASWPACRVPHCCCTLHRIGARHGEIEALIMRREDFGDSHDLQPVILAVEQGVLIFARRRYFIAHRLGRHIHAEQDTKIGLFADAVAIEFGEIAAPRLARFYLKDSI
jgi:hypothetical protein